VFYQRLGGAVGGDGFFRLGPASLARLCDLVSGGNELRQKRRLPEACGWSALGGRAGGNEGPTRCSISRGISPSVFWAEFLVAPIFICVTP
jgi:hypothetical protein